MMTDLQIEKLTEVQTHLLDLLILRLASRTAGSLAQEVNGLVDALATVTQIAQIEAKNAQILTEIAASPATATGSDLVVASLNVLRR